MIKLFNVAMHSSVDDALLNTLHSNYITQGPKVVEFEKDLCKWLGVSNILSLNSCTSALQLAVYLAGIRHGDLIISTPMTCSATNTAIKAVGGQIIWADINPYTGNIDPNSVDQVLQEYPNAKAIMAVHWAGYPCDLQDLILLADFHNIPLIEDAAHAFGAKYEGKLIGNHSDFVAFSFQAIKHLTTIDGGALVCNLNKDHEKGKLLRWFGIDREATKIDNRIEQDIIEAGWKYHMNDVNATIGIANLKHTTDIVNKHIENGRFYDDELQDIPGITLLERKPRRRSAYWVYTLLVKDRAKFIVNMKAAGIETSQVHSRLDKHTAFRDAYHKELPGVDLFSGHQINIPVGWWVTETDRQYIVDTIKRGAPWT